jgi:TonB family protein
METVEMQVAAQLRRRIIRWVALSAALHLTIIALLMIVREHRKTQVVVDQATKFYPAAVYFQGSTRAAKTHAPPGRKRRTPNLKPPPPDLLVKAQPAPAAGRPIPTPDSTAPGNGADQQSAYPAFPVFSPRPAVLDRSLLPRSNQEVVVDVKVSPDGDVLEATLVKGLGNGLDQIVLDTVKTWRFHPATLNGNAIATEAELIFPFNLSYPTSPS